MFPLPIEFCTILKQVQNIQLWRISMEINKLPWIEIKLLEQIAKEIEEEMKKEKTKDEESKKKNSNSTKDQGSTKEKEKDEDK